ncbi:MAG: M3 family metallopeptidase [Odoribacteraceae bacterium]|jgi:peptidyl-dipeptidase Dcp|nr:M3 family metallopeptidase [Odoribacteraceae bacterium]
MNQPTAARRETGENPLLQEFDTPFGAPPFHLIRPGHYLPAIQRAIRVHDDEISVIANNPAAPTFENTILPFDRSGKLLRRVGLIFFNMMEVDANSEMNGISMTIAPLMAAHEDDVMMNEKLFSRVKALRDAGESLKLDPVAARALDRYYVDFSRGGAFLTDYQKGRVKEINAELATLALLFGEHLRREIAANPVIVDDPATLAGLPAHLVNAAAAAAARDGREGKWKFTLHRSNVDAILCHADDRSFRQRVHREAANLGARSNENDNKSILRLIAARRLEKANVMGYKCHADYALEENMAKTPDAVYAFLDRVLAPALRVANEELEALNALADNHDVEPWDWLYYTEKLRQQKFGAGAETLAPYLLLDNVREGMFDVANRLYGITFHRRDDIPAYHPDVERYEARERDGSHLGILYIDYYSRDSKSAGAWMTEFRHHSPEPSGDHLPHVAIVFNLTKRAEGEPTLLAWDDVTTLFHEFGHALHGLFSRGAYRRVSGTIPADMVELPSQIMENWASEPAVMKRYARHFTTGEPIPDALANSIRGSLDFNQGFATVEYLASAYLDMDWHTLELPARLSVAAFDERSMTRRHILSRIPPRHHSSHFLHIFNGEYAAGYYVYLWAEVLDTDAFKAFKETGDIFNPLLAEKFRRHILAEGGFGDPMTRYVNFRGANPSEQALLEKRGLLPKQDNNA